MSKIKLLVSRCTPYIICTAFLLVMVLRCVFLYVAYNIEENRLETGLHNTTLNYFVKTETPSNQISSMSNIIEPVVETEPEQEIEIVSVSLPLMAVPEMSEYVYYDIPLSDELQEYTEDVCETYEVDPELVFALMDIESAYTEDIVSKTSDYGLLQINKCNHKWLSKELQITDFLDAKSNILAGVRLINAFAQYGWDEVSTLMCYNLGVSGAKKKWNKGIYSTGYTDKVMRVKNELVERK